LGLNRERDFISSNCPNKAIPEGVRGRNEDTKASASWSQTTTAIHILFLYRGNIGAHFNNNIIIIVIVISQQNWSHHAGGFRRNDVYWESSPNK
jgi:hypothetical protein